MSADTARRDGNAAVGLSDRQRLDWLQLCRSDNIGPRTFAYLMRGHGSAEAALAALPELVRRNSAGRQIRIASRDSCEREIEAMARMGATVVALCEPTYPPALAAIDAPPPLLAVRGDMAVLLRAMVAIVGSRNASAAGLAMTERLTHELVHGGFVIASGLARGIDARAHRASLRSGTVAVLAGGLDRPYPPENVPLLESILEHGAVVSEMPLGYEPRGRDFPRRNRVIAGLALGTIVVEAARRSGSLITARFANEQGREVFAVPGHPLDPRAEGTNDLLRQGATLCTSADDVIGALTPLLQMPPPVAPALFRDSTSEGSASLFDELDGVEDEVGGDEQGDGMLDVSPLAPATRLAAGHADAADLKDRVLNLLGPAPVSIDDLVRAAAAPFGPIQLVLVELELDGRIERVGGNRVALRIGSNDGAGAG